MGGRRVVGMNEVIDRDRNHLMLGVAQQLTKRTIGVEQRGVWPNQESSNGSIFQDTAKKSFAVLEVEGIALRLCLARRHRSAI